MQQWIKFNPKYAPPYGERVMVVFDNEIIKFGRYSAVKRGGWVDIVPRFPEGNKVTHWAPCPELPNKENTV